MESFLIGHSCIGHEHHYLEFVSNGCCEKSDYECPREDHRAGKFCTAGQTAPTRMPVPIPKATFASQHPGELPSGPWTHYLPVQEVPSDWQTRFGLDKNIKLFDPQYNVDQVFDNHRDTFFDDWWDQIQAPGFIPANELQFKAPKDGAAAQKLVEDYSQRLNVTKLEFSRRIVHRMTGKRSVAAVMRKHAPKAKAKAAKVKAKSKSKFKVGGSVAP